METQTPIGTNSPTLPRQRLTYEEFLAWCSEDTWAEWVDGEVQMVSPASTRHQDLAGFLYVILRHWVEKHELGVVLTAPYQMHLTSPAPRGREPDLLFVSRAHRDRLLATHLEGPADLVLEIVSPESIARDRGEKFVEYEAAGIAEYWLIDPERRQAEFYQRGSEGRYRLALGGAEGTYVSPLLRNLPLPVEWLWQEPLPPLGEALRDLRLIG